MSLFYVLKQQFGLTSRMLKPVRGRRIGWFLKLVAYLAGISHFFRFKRGGYRMHAYSDPFSFWLWTHPTVYRCDERIIEKLLIPGDTFVDVGANCGLHTLHAAYLVGIEGQVYAFEPVPSTWRKLERNIRLNSFINTEVYNAAVGNTTSDKKMEVSYVSDLNYISDNGNIRVKMVRLDDVIKDTHIKLLKIDVEGYELFVLKGAENLIENTDYIMIELCEESFKKYGYTTKELLLHLKHRGFTLFAVKRDGKLQTIDENYLPNQKYEDVLASRFGSLVNIQSDNFTY